MKVLILTKEEYVRYIYDVIGPYFKDNFMAVYHGEKPFVWEEWGSIGYDIGISFMYAYKIPAEEVSTHKWYNFHPGPLPAYKGRNLCYHAIMNGEKNFGATVHFMDENFDTGPIIDVWTFPIHEWMTAGDVSKDAIETSKALFEEYFPQIVANEHFETLPNEGGTYYEKEQIIEEVPVRPDDPFGQFVRAVTCGDFHPRIDIGGRKYKIVREE